MSATSVSARIRRPAGGDRTLLLANVGARVGALVSLGAATVLVARTGGPEAVGLLALLRVLPGLVGVMVSCGLPGAVPYFLSSSRARSGPVRDDGATAGASVRATLLGLDVAGALAAGLVWLVGAPLLHRVFFAAQPLALVAWCASAVLTQQLVAVGKALLQGGDDLGAANTAILAEEAAFLPAFLPLLPILRGPALLLAALVAADVLVAAGIYLRLWRRGFFAGLRTTRPHRRLAREVTRYGARGQLGSLLLLLNLRLDFALLGALAGPAVLGVYSVASKYAELLRLPGLAVSYVLYPRFARQGAWVARTRTRQALPRAAALTALAALPLAASAPLLLPVVYGRQFAPAVGPALILLGGLVLDGAAGLVTAYLYATRRPGRNSAAMAAGVAVTAVLDVLLIPRLAAVGAALASAAAYLVTTGVLVTVFAVTRGRPDGSRAAPGDDRRAGGGERAERADEPGSARDLEVT
ncbi:MAG TPA: lipopolysaccharide biosynthesis protein [Kineosporiaceae bacterium]